MGSEKISYAGVTGAVAGFVGIMGLATGWFTDGAQVVEGTADVSGKLAFAMAMGTFVFGGAYILMSDPGIRRAMGAIMTLCAVMLTLSVLWGLQRADLVLANGGTDKGLLLSALGGLLGVCGGLVALQASIEADEAEEGRDPEREPEPERAAARAE
jgi:hypothetical protein